MFEADISGNAQSVATFRFRGIEGEVSQCPHRFIPAINYCLAARISSLGFTSCDRL